METCKDMLQISSAKTNKTLERLVFI